MNVFQSRSRLPILALGIVVLGATTACAPSDVKHDVQRATGLHCQFELTPVQLAAPPPGSDEPPKLEELLQDTDSAFRKVNKFWGDHWAQCFDTAYQAPGRKAKIIPSGEEVPCGTGSIPSDNAAYCRPGRFVAVGMDLINKGEKIGDMVTYVTIAHELGHSVQDQLLHSDKYAGLVRPLGTKGAELQADCLAGAALAGSYQEGSFEWEEHDAQEVNRAYAEFGDLESNTSQTHGDATERVGQFEQGREGGVGACFSLKQAPAAS